MVLLRRRDDRQEPFGTETSGAQDGLDEDLRLEPELGGIGDMGPGCAGALFLASAGRNNAVRRRFEHLDGFSNEHTFSLSRDPSQDQLIGEHATHEDGLAVVAMGQAFAAVDKFFHTDADLFIHPRIFLMVLRRASVSADFTM
jgi:hypothetical protein